jgi:hypothetical protein
MGCFFSRISSSLYSYNVVRCAEYCPAVRKGWEDKLECEVFVKDYLISFLLDVYVMYLHGPFVFVV